MPFDLNDPRLTAYALGEIDDEAQRLAVEAEIATDHEAQALVDGIRETAQLLIDELRREALPMVGTDQLRSRIERELDQDLNLDSSEKATVPFPVSNELTTRSAQPSTDRVGWIRLSIAAGLVALMGGGAFVYRAFLSSQRELQLAHADLPAAAPAFAPAPAAPAFKAAPGQPGDKPGSYADSARKSELVAFSSPVAEPIPTTAGVRLNEAPATAPPAVAIPPAPPRMMPSPLATTPGTQPLGQGMGGSAVPSPPGRSNSRFFFQAQGGQPQAQPGQTRVMPDQNQIGLRVATNSETPALKQAQGGLGGRPSAGQSGQQEQLLARSDSRSLQTRAGSGRTQDSVQNQARVSGPSNRGMQQGLESAAVTGTDRGKPIGGEGLSLTRNAPQPRRESAPAKPMSGTGRDFDQANPAPAEARSKPLVAKGEAARDIKDAPASLVKRKEMNDAVALKQRGEPLQEKEALAKPMAPAPVPEPQPESKKNASALIPAQPEAPPNREVYAPIVDNPFLPAIANPLSTFSIDVDTASYANVRRFLNQNMKPPKDAVRIEEMLNYFPYSDPGPKDDKPFAFNVEIAACPWNAEDRLVRVALKAKEIDANKRPASNLVFLIDVSGSMSDLNKLPLLKAGMKLLIDQLTENDRVAIVVYAGEARVALPSTPCHRKKMIIDVLDSLEAGGSTAGGAGIELAYREAVQHFIKGGTNRVILATDGDFNVGVDKDQLLKTSEERAKTGVFLSVLGFGEGNLQEAFMEQLADKGNGHYAYIDNIAEARKVLVGEMAGTLVTVAKDVKIQVEFNPAKVKAYRLIGYENRVMAAQDFRDDKKDAGEIGAGHGVTALYEITPADAKSNPVGDNLDGIKLKYGRPGDAAAPKPNPAVPTSPESLTVFLRYKAPDGDVAKELEQGVVDKGLGFGQASADFKFSAAVAGFGMLLRDSPYKGSLTFSGVAEYAAGASVGDPTGYRQEFVELVKQAQTVYGQ